MHLPFPRIQERWKERRSSAWTRSENLKGSAIIGKQARIAASAVLASIGVERIFDFMVVIVLFGVLLITSEKLPDYVTAAGFVAIFMVVAGLITIVSLMVPSKTRRSVRMMVIRYLPEKLSVMIRSQIKRSLIGFSTLGSPSLVIKVLFLSLLDKAAS